MLNSGVALERLLVAPYGCAKQLRQRFVFLAHPSEELLSARDSTCFLGFLYAWKHVNKFEPPVA